MLDWLARFAAPWNTLYSDSPVISTTVVFAHLAAIVVAAATALGADRRALRCITDREDRTGYLAAADAVHRTILLALSVVIAAGVMLFLADVAALAGSLIYRVKLLLIVLLLGNGLAIMKIENRLRSNPENLSRENAWAPLGITARFSQTLWFATIFAGVALRNI